MPRSTNCFSNAHNGNILAMAEKTNKTDTKTRRMTITVFFFIVNRIIVRLSLFILFCFHQLDHGENRVIDDIRIIRIHPLTDQRVPAVVLDLLYPE